MAWSKFTDLELTDEEKIDSFRPPAVAQLPDYPYGLRISLDQRTLKKLKLEPDCEIGDYIDMRCLGRVMSVSINDQGGDNQTCCVEIQIEKMALEDEDQEETPGDEED